MQTRISLSAIAKLDLEPIMVKLMDKEEGEGWTLEQVMRAARRYRQFLSLAAKYPDRVIVPTGEIDEFWHAHILDTEKYAEDCERIFGSILHHFPYFGMRCAQDLVDLRNAFNATVTLFFEEFGEMIVDSVDSGEQGSSCRKGCGARRCKISVKPMDRPRLPVVSR